MIDLLLRGCRLPDREGVADVRIAEGRVVAVGAVDQRARETVEVRGRLVTPGLVEAHWDASVGPPGHSMKPSVSRGRPSAGSRWRTSGFKRGRNPASP